VHRLSLFGYSRSKCENPRLSKPVAGSRQFFASLGFAYSFTYTCDGNHGVIAASFPLFGETGYYPRGFPEMLGRLFVSCFGILNTVTATIRINQGPIVVQRVVFVQLGIGTKRLMVFRLRGYNLITSITRSAE